MKMFRISLLVAALALLFGIAPHIASAQQLPVYCAPGAPCNQFSGPVNTHTGDPPWEAFGKLNAWGTQLGLFSFSSSNLFLATPPNANGIVSLRAITASDLPISGVTAGSYTCTNITVDQYGRITSAMNGTCPGGGGMVYPGAGIPNSTGTAWGTSYSVTGSGNVVLSTSPTLVTPALGSATASGLTLSGITGSTQCLHVNTSGVVSGTGSDCPSGGGSGTVTDGSGTTTAGQFAISTTTPHAQAYATTSAVVLADIQASTTFTVAGTGCTPSAHTGGPFGGTVTLASGPCTALVITINGATGFTAPNGYHCNAGDRTAMAAGNDWIPSWTESATTTTTVTLPIPAGAAPTDVISFACDYF